VIASTDKVFLDSMLIGLAMAASPFGIVAVIVLLGTKRPKANAISFTVGWMCSIAAVGLLTASLATAGSDSSSSTSSGKAAVQLALGVLALVGAGLMWRRRVGPGSAEEPAWLKRAERLTPIFSFFMGAFLPTWGLILPAVNQILAAGLTRRGTIAAFLVFLVASTMGLLVPLTLYLTRPEESAAQLAGWRTWLLRNNKAVIAVILAILGLLFVARGFYGLAT
jgi:hypothetical protein